MRTEKTLKLKTLETLSYQGFLKFYFYEQLQFTIRKHDLFNMLKITLLVNNNQ